ncbi:DUF4214 domain-containing protein [Campylobacter rectus]|uniref:DUF4214 domain-containing protein n=1 Tax=Campylobacter rectus TaxID=203 RepID=UPI000F5F3AA3|nr:DUF4214 domain-containing protein [Campylobacter rectus]RRD52786.1 DUF4214 domain-containing protein [Campylobacter rectus]
MSITSIDISALYITMFNRVPEGAGHKFWFNLAKKQGLNTSQVAQQMLNSAPAQEYFAGKNSNEDFVNHIYSNLFGKTIAQDPKGSKFWIDKLKEGNSKAFVVSEMLKAAMSNTYTKPEELKAQKLFLNKLKAAEIAHKAIENVPSSGSITEKIASFANILKNIKDTSTPTQIAQVIKQEALKGNLTVLNSHQLAQITKSIFPSVDADALQKALDNTTATTDIYEEGGSTPTPPTPPAPTPNPGGGSSGGSNNPKPLTPEEQKQKAKEEAVKQAEENLQKAKEAAEQAKKDADIAKEIKDAVEHAINNHNGIKQYALNHIQNKIDDPSTTNEQREALEKAKDIVNTFGRTLDDKKLTEVTGEAEIADKTKDVADKQKDLAQDQVEYAKAVAKEAPLLDAVKKAYEDYAKAQDEKTIADLLSQYVRSLATINSMKAKIETSDDLTYQQKLVAKAKLDAWIKGLNLDLDEQLDNATKAPIQAKAKANKDAADAKFENAKKAYDDGDAGALHDHAKNKEEIKTSSGESAKAKADAASAIVALKKAKEDIAKANLDKDPDNEELKAALQKAQDELKKAQAEEKSAKTTANVENFGTVELKKVGDTNVYKSEDGKYTVDLGNDKVTDGKTLAVGRGSYKLYEIDENSTDAGAPKHTDKTVLYSHDKGGSVYKNGVEQFSFLSKDGNAVAALKAGGKGFILKPGVKTDYDTMSKANFNDADGKFEIGGADQKAYQIETEKTPSPHNPDNPQYSVTKIKNFEGRDYNFKDKPILDGDFKITGTKDLKDDLKIPLINGKIYAGRVGDYHINTDSDNNLKSLTDEATGTYNFDADEKVESITKFGYTYNLKGGHKTLADAIALASGAQNKLNKASSTVVNNYTNDVFRLDNDGKATSVQLYNKNELTVRDLTSFKPDRINTLKISEIKFASGEKFTLTGDHKYNDVRHYEKVAGKFLLKHGGQYKNSVYEKDGHKVEVTDAGEGTYTLTETKDGNTVSVEKFRDGITKTVDANGVTLSGTESNDSDTITVKDGQTTVDASGDAKNVGIDNINAGKVSFNSVEEVRVNSNTALDKKGLDVLNKAADKIVLDNGLTLKNADGGLLDLTKVINYNNNLTVNVANNAKADTIKFGAKVTGDKLNINGFEQTQDKVDFSAFGLGKDNFVNDAVADNAGAELKGGKVYKANVSANGSVSDLFGAGKAFATVQANAKSIVLAKTATDTKAYLVNDANGNGTIEANELKLLGTFNGDVGDLSADNIA